GAVPSGSVAAASAPAAPASSAPAAGGIDAAAIRRVWPDVLARIFQMRRATWTFVSQHAQVLEYDGNRLVLGIGTVGLANTFRQGNHAELVRQALIDEIGIDVPVEGIPTPADATPVSVTPVAPGSQSSQMAPPPRDDDDGSRGQPPPFEEPSAPFRPGLTTPVGAGLTTAADASPPAGADWSARSEPAPDWASASGPTAAVDAPVGASVVALVRAPAEAASAAPVEAAAETPTRTGLSASEAATQANSVRQQIGEARRQSADQRGSSRSRGRATESGQPTPPADRVVDDSQASVDDEDIVETGAVGREVIERVLGGTFLGDFED
ncbi:MAG: hypothetical protein ABI890_10965, partial [Lapillicoccus sp.]